MQKNKNETTLAVFEFPNGITVETDYDHITIRHGDEELVHWISDEWAEDDTVTTGLASWIAFAALHSRDEIFEELGHQRCDKCGHAQGKFEEWSAGNVCPTCMNLIADRCLERRDGNSN